MAVPKRKTSKTRRDKRRASSYRLPRVTITECPNCHEPKLPHRVCRSCGYYDGEEILSVEAE
ncbi:50S ribosomal protein L32 [Lagierella sp.]|uniref:50S ribosomal protein L32 n=1 Tax=Lagierella sp. TaxID=2849657 RepID=UPI0026102696|nr:50S ribosomal protein L32 [Lagierella sp.]